MRLVNLRIVFFESIHVRCGWITPCILCIINSRYMALRVVCIKIKIYKLIICVEFNKIEFKSKIFCSHRS